MGFLFFIRSADDCVFCALIHMTSRSEVIRTEFDEVRIESQDVSFPPAEPDPDAVHDSYWIDHEPSNEKTTTSAFEASGRMCDPCSEAR